MTKFEELMAEYDDELIVEERSIKIDGLYADGVAWIKYNLTNAEKYCTLAEELGHHYTTSGNIINQNDVDNQKQELRARRWAYEKILPAEEILRAASAGCSEVWQFAEFLEVSEEFMRSALIHYGILDIA